MLERFNRWIRNLTGFKVQRTFKYFVMKQKNVHTAWVQGEKWRVQQKCGGSFWNATADWLFFSECFRVDQSEDALQLVGLRHAWGPWFCSKLKTFETFFATNVLEKQQLNFQLLNWEREFSKTTYWAMNLSHVSTRSQRGSSSSQQQNNKYSCVNNDWLMKLKFQIIFYILHWF